MHIDSIYEPVETELQAVKKHLQDIALTLDNQLSMKVFSHFFDQPGKFLRPTLLLLSAGAVTKENKVNQDAIQLAVICELIHSASLIHDDIIDQDSYRRGKPTLNAIYDSKIAVLAGDSLHGYAYNLLAKNLPLIYGEMITELSIKMCLSEIHQARGLKSKSDYYQIIKGKTADFTAVCSKVGGMIGRGSADEIMALESYGYHFGLMYQLLDDYCDNDVEAEFKPSINEIEAHRIKADQALDSLQESAYKRNLKILINYILKDKY